MHCIILMSGGGVGSRNYNYYACALFIIDGLGHAMWSSTMLGSRSQTASFWRKSHINFRALVVVEPLVSLMNQFGACSARTSGDRQTDRPNTVTLAAHAHVKGYKDQYLRMYINIHIFRYCYEVGSAHLRTAIEISTKLQQHCHYLSVATE